MKYYVSTCYLCYHVQENIEVSPHSLLWLIQFSVSEHKQSTRQENQEEHPRQASVLGAGRETRGLRGNITLSQIQGL
ncbi:hypothetical protein O3P69_017156 [Scylla paramamosain]|uniref:Uncharacterized protein n=1 Tax=Scylla paramamosain TaxID=85552 RepID=A0AAW0TXM5_SCYPA